MESVKLVFEYSVDEEYYPDGKVRVSVKEKERTRMGAEQMLPPPDIFDSHIDHIFESFKYQLKEFRKGEKR